MMMMMINGEKERFKNLYKADLLNKQTFLLILDISNYSIVL